MRDPDKNRAKKALEHIKAACTVLRSIKWENVNTLEDGHRIDALDRLDAAADSINCML